MKVAIVGKGKAGKAIGAGLERIGHEVRYGHRDPNEPVDKATGWGEMIIVAVPYSQLSNAAKEIGSNADGKTLIDCTNTMGVEKCDTSAAEELQNILPRSKVVKAFNTVFARNQDSGKVGGETLTAFIAGDDEGAKSTVMELTRDLGFEPLDCGALQCARYLESMGKQIITLAFDKGMGTSIGYRLVSS